MKKVVLVLCIILSLLVMVYFGGGAPLLLDIVKRKAESLIQQQLDVSVRIGSVKGNIFHKLEITDVNIEKTVELGRINISYDIFKLLSKEIVINYLFIDSLRVDVNQAEILTRRLLDKAKVGEKRKKTEFKVHIGQLAIANCDMSGIMQNKQLDGAVAMRGQLLAGKLLVDTLVINTDNSNISIRGSVPLDKTSELDVTYSAFLMLEDFLLNDPDIRGTVVSNGSVKGTMAAPFINSNATLNISYQRNSLEGTIGAIWQTPNIEDLTINAQLNVKTKSLNTKKKQQEQWHFALQSQGRTISCDAISSYGTMNIKGAITGDIKNPTVFATVTSKLQLSSFTPHIYGTIVYEKQKISLNDMKVKSRELMISGNGAIALEDPQKMSANITTECSDVNIVKDFIEIPSDLHGRLFANAKISGTIKDPLLAGSLRLEEIDAFNERITSADFDVKYKYSIFQINSGVIYSARGVAEVDGIYNIADGTLQIHLKSEKIVLNTPEIFHQDTVMVGGDIGFAVDLYGNLSNLCGEGDFLLRDIVYDTLMLGDYDLHVDLKDSTVRMDLVREDRTMQCNAHVRVFHPYPFSVEVDLRHFNFAEYIASDEAYISGRISAHGDGFAPEMLKGLMLIDTLYVCTQQTPIHNTEAINILFDRQVVDVISCALSIHGQRLDVKGQVPFDIASGSMNLRVETSEIEMADLAAVIPGAPPVSGILQMDGIIQGQLNNIIINGQIDIKSLKYVLQDIVVDSGYSHILFQDSTVRIEHARGKINEGSFVMSGYAVMSNTGVDSAGLDISISKVNMKNKEFGSAVFSGSMLVNANRDTVNIKGDINIDKAVYEVPFNIQTMIQILTKVNQPPREQLDVFSRIYCNIDVSSSGGIGIKNNVAIITVDADLQIKGYLSKINVYGTIATSGKGMVKYLGRRFDIESAVLQFDNPYEIDPNIDVNASHVVTSTEGDYEIYLHVGGILRDWRLELTSSPPVPEQDMISLLLIGKRRPGSQLMGDLNLIGTAKDYALGLAGGTIEKTAERTLGVAKFTITGDLLKPAHLDIGIEKNLFKKFTFIYTTGIESWELRRIGINYDLTDNVSVFTLHDQENLNSSVDLDFHFDIE